MGGGPSPGTNLYGEGDKVPGGEDVVFAHHGGGWGEGLPQELTCVGKVTRFPEGKMLLSHTTVADKVPGGEDVVVAHHSGRWGEGLPQELTCVGKVTRFLEGKMLLSHTTVADGGRAFPRN